MVARPFLWFPISTPFPLVPKLQFGNPFFREAPAFRANEFPPAADGPTKKGYTHSISKVTPSCNPAHWPRLSCQRGRRYLFAIVLKFLIHVFDNPFGLIL